MPNMSSSDRWNTYYILDGHTVVPCDHDTWLHWISDEDNFQKKRVALTQLGDLKVSTVFLGLDHNFSNAKIAIFETMVFGGPGDEDMERYSTWDEAVEGHQRMVDKWKDVKTSLQPPSDPV